MSMLQAAAARASQPQVFAFLRASGGRGSLLAVRSNRHRHRAPLYHSKPQRSAKPFRALGGSRDGSRDGGDGGPLGAPGGKEGGGSKAPVLAGLGVLSGIILLVGAGVAFKDQISAFIDFFITAVEQYGPMGVVAYAVVYAGLELLAVPAIPLTMSAGAIFGVLPGTAIVSVAATAACAGSFLIARYVARDRVAQYASSHPRFSAIDRAIGKDGFRVVLFLRLSPLLPLAASNYLYGLTSVDFPSYVLASWLGMLPGTLAYVALGSHLGQAAEGGGIPLWQAAPALGATGFALWYVGRLATKAIAQYDAEFDHEHAP